MTLDTDSCRGQVGVDDLKLEQRPITLPGPHFCGARPGLRVPFVHPVTGAVPSAKNCWKTSKYSFCHKRRRASGGFGPTFSHG